jgi:hypothetical protein
MNCSVNRVGCGDIGGIVFGNNGVFTVTRRRWVLTNLGWAFLAAAAWQLRDA